MKDRKSPKKRGQALDKLGGTIVLGYCLKKVKCRYEIT